MRNIIYFTEKELEKAINFANSIKWKHNKFVDNSKKTDKQTHESIVRGKLAEIALKKYLKNKHGDNHKIKGLDFNIYKEGICDNFDLMFDNYKISIKSSKPLSSCLLIEKSKYKLDYNGNVLSVDGHYGDIPDFYVFIKVGLNFNNLEKTYADICGAVSHREFWSKKKEIPKGTYINKINMDNLFKREMDISELKSKNGIPLAVDNYGYHIDFLREF